MLADGVWSVVTPVPTGYREFCFVVDGRFTVSTKHPTTADGTCNWRTVYGPPSAGASPHTQRPGAAQLARFLTFSEAVAESVRHIFIAAPRAAVRAHRAGSPPGRRGGDQPRPRVSSRWPATTGGSAARDVESHRAGRAGGHREPRAKDRPGAWLDRPLRVVLLSVAAYAVFALGYVLSHHFR
jgi:hypothetical protein